VGAVNACLEIILYRNRLQLAAGNVLYSDSGNYLPALAIVKNLKAFLSSVNNVLVLGAGLGSIVNIIRKNGFNPHFTLVENDKVVLQWALECLAEQQAKITPVCMDAAAFMAKNTAKYDFIFIDIFNRNVVPDFVVTPLFLDACRNSRSDGGRIAFNYMVNDKKEWGKVQGVFNSIFPGCHVLDLGINCVFITPP